jgi:hypothetical protein
MKNGTFLIVRPCRLTKVCPYLVGPYFFVVRVKEQSEKRSEQAGSKQRKLSAPELQGNCLCFHPEDRGSTFLWIFANFRLKRRYITEDSDCHFLDSFLSREVVAVPLIQITGCVWSTHPFWEDVWVITIIETRDMLFLALSAIMSDVTLIHLAA